MVAFPAHIYIQRRDIRGRSIGENRSCGRLLFLDLDPRNDGAVHVIAVNTPKVFQFRKYQTP